MGIGKLIDGVEEGEDLTVVLQESDDRLVETRQFLIGFITARVMGASAVEHIAATVAALILGDALAIRKAEDLHHQRTLCIVLREGGGTILGMGLVGIEVGGLIAVGTTGNGLNLLELREFCQFLKDLHQMGVVEKTSPNPSCRRGICTDREISPPPTGGICASREISPPPTGGAGGGHAIHQQFPEVLNGGGNGLEEVFLLLEVATEAVGTQHLKCAEEHKQGKAIDDMSHRRHLGIVLQ